MSNSEFSRALSAANRPFARRAAVKAAWVAPAIVATSAAPALACSPDSQPPETHSSEAQGAHTLGTAPPPSVAIAIPEWATVMTFTVIGGGGGVDSNRNGDSGRPARITGTIVLEGQASVTLKPGSAGQINGNAGRSSVPGGKAASNSLTANRPNGGDGRGGWGGGGGAASVLEVDGAVAVIAGGGGGTSQSLTSSIGGGQYVYDGGNTRTGQIGEILQGNGYAGVPGAVDSVAAGNRGEGAFVRVSAYGSQNFSASSNGPALQLAAVSTGVNGGAGGSASGGAGGRVPNPSSYVSNGLQANGEVGGQSGASGSGGTVPALLGSFGAPAAGGGGGGFSGGGAGGLSYGRMNVYRRSNNENVRQNNHTTGTGSGGGGGSSWVSDIIVGLSAEAEPNTTTPGGASYFGKHGRVAVTFSC